MKIVETETYSSWFLKLRDSEGAGVHVLEDGDPDLLVAALADVTRAVGPAGLATQSGVSIETIEQIMSGSLDLDIATVGRVLRGVGVRLSVATNAVSGSSAVGDQTGLR